MELIVPYYKEYINLVSSFVEEIGRSHGAEKEELFQLRLIGEETFIFILNGIPNVGLDRMFHLRCMEEEDGLAFLFTNHGRPMNVREIPVFDMERMDETVDALSLSMIRCFSHEFGFQNRGKEGWELLVRFKINKYRHLGKQNEVAQEFTEGSAEPVVVRKATVEDIPGIINLVYNTYRYSYAKEVFYNEVSLARLFEEEKILSLVAVTQSGRVVGHNAILLESKHLGEVGMSMVDPSYRKSKTFLSLVLNTSRVVKKEYPELLIYAKCVTSHKKSQAFVTSFTTCLLQLSVYAHASFIGIQGEANARESLVYSIALMGKLPGKRAVYVSPEHLDFIQDIFRRAMIEIDCMGHAEVGYADKETALRSEILPGRQYAELSLERLGEDFVQILHKETIHIRQNGVVTASLSIPTHQPLVRDLDAVLMREGYFFCGIEPSDTGEWLVVYTNLLYQSFDFEKLQFFDEESSRLKDYVKALYEKTLEA